MKNKILLIEDDDRLRRILQLVLQSAGHDVLTAADGQEGTGMWKEQRPDIVLTDLQMAPGDGLFVLAFGKKHDPETPVILLTAFGTVETAVLAMKDGAFDYLTKPVDNNELLEVVAEALSSKRNVANEAGGMIGGSPVIQTILQNIKVFGAADSSVMITGESGTGKELAAQAIHQASGHAAGPFVRVNCAAIPGELLESELFGHVRGAFTGSVADRAGAFQEADGGTLFLDEIGDLPLALQPKILHAVEEKTITPVGSNTLGRITVKILSASNRDLALMIEEKTFRQDLYYRLNRLHLHLPPVREREGDIDMLLDYFLEQFCRRLKKRQLGFSPEALELLQRYSWPGNVREIKNVIERAVLTCEGSEITSENLPSNIQAAKEIQPPGTGKASTDLNHREQQLITTVLRDCNWNQSEAARKLGVTRNTLRYRIMKYGISKSR